MKGIDMQEIKKPRKPRKKVFREAKPFVSQAATQCKICGEDRMPHKTIVLCEKHWRAYVSKASGISHKKAADRKKAELAIAKQALGLP
jgi:hypothetical protein